MSGLDKPRFGILGPGRTRDGLGPFHAAAIEQAGGRLVAIAARSFRSLERAAPEIERRAGHGVTGYVGLDAMLADAELDALVIASPVETHEDALLGALDAGLHVLCEKPILPPARLAADRVEMLADSFFTRGLHLQVNVQWPCTLRAYFALCPEVQGKPLESFWMRLSPSERGLGSLAESLPHPLSLLQALVPDPDPLVRAPEIEILTEDGSAIRVTFVYDGDGTEVLTTVDLTWCADQPRPAGYGINGCTVMRELEMPEYRTSFARDGRRVPVPDPLTTRVGEFVAMLRAGPPAEIDVSAAARMRMLETLIA